MSVDINFENADDSYFLKTVYQKHQAFDPLREKQDFVLVGPAEESVLSASLGPYTTQQKIPHTLLRSIAPHYGDGTMTRNDVIFSYDVTAHVVTEHLSKRRPKLQVFFHATPNGDNTGSSKRKGKSMSRTPGAPERQGALSLCGHVYVNNNVHELSSICVLSSKGQSCVTDTDIPENWWHENATAKISYAFSQVENNQECASASNSIVPGRSFENPVTSRKQLIKSINLNPDEQRFTEEKEEGIVVYVPTDIFDLGTIFEIPVKLQENSYVQNFVMR